MYRKNLLLRGIIAVVCGAILYVSGKGQIFVYSKLPVDLAGLIAVVVGIAYIVASFIKKK